MGYTLHVVSHTHWDREWYQPFELFRLRLVDLIDRLLDLMESDPGFRYFNLDGQGIVLEDYVKIRPENEERLRRLIREGRITIGPWYVLNDEFLVSGEATVRSLLIGHRVVERFGPVMKVGYLPDQFGNIGQMPQILRGFGIDNCIFGRGWQAVDGRKMEFEWVSPDDSSVLASLMAFWYNNAQDIPEDAEAGAQWAREIRERMAAISGSRHLLLMNGVDHLEAQYNLSRALASINEALKEDVIEHSTLPRYVQALREEAQSGDLKPEQFRGELREDRWGSILAGTLSSRVYLKQANERCQRLLEKFAEPASVWASLAGDGWRYPSGELEYAWKLLMENHPHDSICGCSLDEVHDEMMTRFAKVEQLGEALRERALRHIAERVAVDGLALVVFNPLTWQRTDVVRATIDIPLGEPARTAPAANPALDWPALEILDVDGATVPYTLISSEKTARSVHHPERLPMAQWVRRFDVEFIASDVPPMGYRVYRLRKAERMPDFGPAMNARDRASLFAETGTLDVCPGASPALTLMSDDTVVFVPSLAAFEDVGDVGDEYNYRRPGRDVRILADASAGQRRWVVEGVVSCAAEVRSALRLPESASADGQGRSERTVDCPVSLTVRAYRGVPRVEVELQIENRARDHRLRALLSSGAEGAEASVAGGAFEAVRRPLHLPAEWPTTPPPSPFHPMDGWVDVSNAGKGMAVLVDGLREYELYDDEERTLGITLLRCVGVLSGGEEIPHVQHTPGAQCQGKHKFRYALYPHTGDWLQAKVWRHALDYQTRLTAVQVGDLDRSRSIERPIRTLPMVHSFVSISDDRLVPSALKREERGNGLVLRFYNITQEEIGARVTLVGAKRAWRSNLAEERLEELPVTDGGAQCAFRGAEIVTLLFEV